MIMEALRFTNRDYDLPFADDVRLFAKKSARPNSRGDLVLQTLAVYDGKTIVRGCRTVGRTHQGVVPSSQAGSRGCPVVTRGTHAQAELSARTPPPSPPTITTMPRITFEQYFISGFKLKVEHRSSNFIFLDSLTSIMKPLAVRIIEYSKVETIESDNEGQAGHGHELRSEAERRLTRIPATPGGPLLAPLRGW
ncbi:hypothetical protein J6590_003401 [Homalodisca vitripennis]|nr:hypothetical protein J6590_003401 [Homalodisca vitripennis]